MCPQRIVCVVSSDSISVAMGTKVVSPSETVVRVVATVFGTMKRPACCSNRSDTSLPAPSYHPSSLCRHHTLHCHRHRHTPLPLQPERPIVRRVSWAVLAASGSLRTGSQAMIVVVVVKGKVGCVQTKRHCKAEKGRQCDGQRVVI